MSGVPCSRKADVPQATVAQRLCSLLLQFPTSSIGGVQWCVLSQKYEERYSARLDLASLGHASPLAAATTLLWDVLRVVDGTDTDNPIVAIEDGVALTAHPGSMGSWPSLYRALCKIVQTSGTLEPVQTPTERPARSLLLSRLKPLLQSQWHLHFDETSLSFLNEQGSSVKVKKMKHLLTAVLRWRASRVELHQSGGRKPSAIDEVTLQKLELAVSTSHNDMVLRCVPREETPPSESRCVHTTFVEQRGNVPEETPEEMSPEEDVTQDREEHVTCEVDTVPPPHLHEVFDDPFEPPPQREAWATPRSSDASVSAMSFSDCGHLSIGSTSRPWHCMGFESESSSSTRASRTPISSLEESSSGRMTPITPMGPPTLGNQVCFLVPMWFPTAAAGLSFLGDRCEIPRGIVERFRNQFEATSVPHATPPMPQPLAYPKH